MKADNLREVLAQASEEESREIFKETMQRMARLAFFEAMEEELMSLCGRKHYPNSGSAYCRAGSEKGVAYMNGKKEDVIRPRVREKDGAEITLETYQAASSQKNLFEEVVDAMMEGISARSAERLTKGAVSKSSASRMWVEKSQEKLEFFRERPIDGQNYIALQVDGLFLGKDIMLVVALGIDREGNKHALDFEQGTSESAETVGNLFARLHKRGLREPAERRLLVQRDGSAAIAKAIKKYYPNALQQECVVHLHRNVKDKLRKNDAEELDLYFKRFREAQGKIAGEEAWKELLSYVNDRNAVAGNAMKEREDALLTVHRLDVPSTLNRTFLSTNIVENAIKNWRQHTGNVKLWNEKAGMVSRWAATGLLWSENTFYRVSHADDLHHLETALSFSVPATVANAPSASTEKDKEKLEQAKKIS